MHGVKFRETEPRPAEIRSNSWARLVGGLALPGARVAIRAELIAVLFVAPGIEIAGEGKGALGIVPGEVLALWVGLAQLLAVVDVLVEGRKRDLLARVGLK